MLKSFLEFLGVGVMVISAYVTYFILTLLATVIIGLPIGLGVYLIQDAVSKLINF